jgi:nitronate monooxygenase
VRFESAARIGTGNEEESKFPQPNGRDSIKKTVSQPPGEVITMPISTLLTRRLGLAHPIIQAPLAGGGDTPELVAAVSNAGALGFIGAAYLTPEQILGTAAAVRSRTSRPFGINLFAPQPPGDSTKKTAPMLARLAPYFAELNLPPPSLPPSPASSFDEQVAAARKSGASAFLSEFSRRASSKRSKPATCS